MKKVGIVICNYNKADKVLECIQCILEQKFTDYDLYVVDNASTDDSVSKIREHYADKVHLLVNASNLGGSGGFNTGLREAYAKGYEYLMCVDNDAFLDENAVGALYDFLEEHSEVGMAASKIYHLENPDYIQQFGQKIDFDYYCTEVPHLNMLEDGSMPEYLYVDSVAACSLMVRRTTIDKIGFLPEENFLYWDDTEWCYLCNLAGMKVASVGTSQALHAMGAKKEDVNTFPTYYAWRNWIRFFLKYTKSEDHEKLARTFLGSIFEVVYAGIHKGESSKLKTVMLAYDDAIHGVMGKAGANRIFDIDTNYEPWERLFAKSHYFSIEAGDYPGYAEWIKSLPEKLGLDVAWVEEADDDKDNMLTSNKMTDLISGDAQSGAAYNGIQSGVAYDGTQKTCCSVENVGDVVTISLCENIFTIDDISLQKIYIDIEGCILQDDNDVLDVINYNYSKRSFIQAQMPVFLQKIQETK